MNTFRVLIVDDEPHVVDFLISLLESQKDLSLDLYFSYDGPHALELIQEGKFDLLITDIQMPGMDGIHLAKSLTERWPLCKIIYFTAWSRFDYAYKALQSQAAGYLLKTESDDYILAQIRATLSSIEEELLQTPSHLPDSLSQPVDYTERQQLFHLLEREDLPENELASLLQGLGFSGRTSWLLTLGIVDELEEWAGYPYSYPPCYALLSRLMSSSTQHMISHQICEMYHPGCFLWLMECETECDSVKGQSMLQWYSGILETVQSAFFSRASLPVSFLFSPLLSSARLLPRALSQGLSFTDGARQNAPFIFQYPFIQQKPPQPAFPSPPGREPQNAFRTLSEMLNRQNFEDFSAALADLCAPFCRKSLRDDSAALELYYSVVLVLSQYASQNRLTSDIGLQIRLNGLYRVSDISDWDSCMKRLTEFSSEIFLLIERRKDNLAHNTVLFIKNYIDDHILESLSLMQLSQATGYNASYISMLFHRETGEVLSSYISRKKLESVNRFLSDPSYTIEEVSRLSGFHSRPYFNQFIKKMTGLSPKAYRARLLGAPPSP